MTEWIGLAITAILGVAGIYFANSIRRQVSMTVAEKRMAAYRKLWALTLPAAPQRRPGVAPLTEAQRVRIFDEMTEWYFGEGHGMLLGEDTRRIYLTAKENLACDVDELEPASLRTLVGAAWNPAEQQNCRSAASIRQLSLLRTSMRADLGILAGPYGDEIKADDQEFLEVCKVDPGLPHWKEHRPGLWAWLVRGVVTVKCAVVPYRLTGQAPPRKQPC